MIERVRYVNHLGASVELNANGVRVNTGELNDWELQASTLNGCIAGFTRDVMEKPVAGIVFKHDSTAALAKLDEFYEVAIVDTDDNGLDEPEYGRLIIGDWYVLCWMRAMATDRTWMRDAADFNMVLISDKPLWTREKTQTFIAEKDGSGLDMGFDYPHDYSASWFSGIVRNASPRRCPVRITVAGPTDGWHVRIADNVYSVSRTLDADEMMVIDGRDESIVHIDSLGNQKSAFGDKAGVYMDGSGSFVFESVPPGDSEIEWNGVDKVEVLVYEQRDQRPFVETAGAL